MCGIAGFTGAKSPEILEKMLNSIFHRGPDDTGMYFGENISMGMNRLSIIDLQYGKQPIHNENKTIWVVFNGEIYNHKELRKKLENLGHSFYTDHSDTEVILHLYEEYGLDFPNELNGMFAIAIWDSNLEKLILVRDRAGVKPLFYSIIENNLIFGSEIKAILENPCSKREINYEALYHYFTLRNIPAPLTAFKDIYSLLPGELMIFSQGNVVKKKWWNLIFKENHDLDEKSAEKTLLELLKDSVNLRMQSDVPYGAYLSGGVDSSAVVAIMANLSNRPVKTFSLGYEDEFKNKDADIFYAQKVHKMFNTEHYEYFMSCKELMDDMENIINAFDQPFSGTCSTYFLSKIIKKHVKVALAGDAADELFGSYLSHRVAQPMYYWKKLYNKYLNNTLTEDDKKLFKPCDIKFLDNLYQKTNGNEIDWRYSLYLFSDKEKQELITNNFKDNLYDKTTYDLIKNYFQNLTATDPLNRILEMEFNTQLPDQVLSYSDILSMSHSVEVRSPFLDYRLMEFAATIPGYLKIKDGVVKNILKESLNGILPEDILKRPKEGFVLPIYDWMNNKMKDFCYDKLSEKSVKSFEFLNYSKVKEILDSHFIQNQKNPAQIWTLLNFQIWCEKYL